MCAHNTLFEVYLIDVSGEIYLVAIEMHGNLIHRHVTHSKFSLLRKVVKITENSFQRYLLHRKHIILDYLDDFRNFSICYLLFFKTPLQIVVRLRKLNIRPEDDGMTSAND